MILFLWFLAQSPDDAALEAAARAVLAKFTAGRFEELQTDFDARMREALPPAKLAAFAEQLAAQAGKFQSVREVKFDKAMDYRVVRLISDYEKTRLDVRVAFDSDGQVAGLFFTPSTSPRLANTRFAGYNTKTPLHLPFDGEWSVFWGGRTLEENY